MSVSMTIQVNKFYYPFKNNFVVSDETKQNMFYE